MFLMKNRYELFSIFQNLTMKLKINLEFPFKFCIVIMDVSIVLILLKILWLLMVFFIKLHVLIHLKKMG